MSYQIVVHTAVGTRAITLDVGDLRALAVRRIDLAEAAREAGDPEIKAWALFDDAAALIVSADKLGKGAS